MGLGSQVPNGNLYHRAITKQDNMDSQRICVALSKESMWFISAPNSRTYLNLGIINLVVNKDKGYRLKEKSEVWTHWAKSSWLSSKLTLTVQSPCFTVCSTVGRQYLIVFPCGYQGTQSKKKNIYGDDIIPRKDSPQKPEIFNPLVKNTKTSSPKHHDLIRNFIQLFHLVTPSQGEKEQSYFSQIWMTDTPQAAASDISLGNWNFSKKLESVLPSGLSCIFYFHRINILLPSTVILFSFLCFFFLYYYMFFFFFLET